MGDYGRKDEITQAPAGLDDVLRKCGWTIGQLKRALSASPTGVRVPESNGLRATARHGAIVVERLGLADRAAIVRIDGRYYLKVDGQSLPATVLSALPGRPLSALIDSDELPAALSASMLGGSTTIAGDLLIDLDWPLAPC